MLRTGHRLRHWLPHQQLCPVHGMDHTHEHAMITCTNLTKISQRLAPCMLPFKLNGVCVRTFHSMPIAHLADSLSRIPGLTA